MRWKQRAPPIGSAEKAQYSVRCTAFRCCSRQTSTLEIECRQPPVPSLSSGGRLFWIPQWLPNCGPPARSFSGRQISANGQTFAQLSPAADGAPLAGNATVPLPPTAILPAPVPDPEQPLRPILPLSQSAPKRTAALSLQQTTTE